VIEREGTFKSIFRKPARGEHRACVVDQDVDTWLVIGDLSRNALISAKRRRSAR
jgi:hypothetical protein